MYWIIREQQKKVTKFNAGTKARADVDSILIAEGFTPFMVNAELDESQNILKKIYLQFTRFFDWKKCVDIFKENDVVVIQYPVRNHTIFLGNILKAIRKKNIKIIGIIHDLESLRFAISDNTPTLSKLRFKYEEITALKYFSKIIVHNEHMKESIHSLFLISFEMMVSLKIFDYLYKPEKEKEDSKFHDPILIAGNLDKQKSGYIYDLPENLTYQLYGANYDEKNNHHKNVIYKGKFNPDDLPAVLEGSFGLVWDGPSAKTCEGVFGEYLKINNPHKCSLYLAAGLPVIIWKQAALAPFIEKNHLGVCVNSLDEIEFILNSISDEEYEIMSRNCREIGKKIRSGYFLTNALRTVMEMENR